MPQMRIQICPKKKNYLAIWFFGEDIVIFINKVTNCSFISLVKLDDRRKCQRKFGKSQHSSKPKSLKDLLFKKKEIQNGLYNFGITYMVMKGFDI